MHRNINHHFNNGNAQRRPDPHYFRTSLNQLIAARWPTTLLGVVGFLAGVIVLVLNEGRAVQVTKSLDESISLVTPLVPEAEVDTSNIGKLVYISGVMTIHEPLTEVDYGISVLAVKLFRNVQMYQWVETENDIIDGQGNVITTTYNYHTEWNNALIDSSLFSNPLTHRNPKEFPIQRQIQINENVKISKYNLGFELKKKFTDFVTITSDERPERPDIKLHSGLYYHCQNIWQPEVGEVRVQFSYAGGHGQVITVVAKLDDNLTLVPYTSKAGVNILILRLGQYSLEDVFVSEHSQNKFLTWIYRGAGWFLIYVSCGCLGTILQIIVSHSVFLQHILPIGHSSLKMTTSISVTLITTALAWVWYRPALGIGLIFMSLSLLVCSKHYATIPPGLYNRF